MRPILVALASFVFSLFRSRKSMQMEIVVLRHQLNVLQRSGISSVRCLGPIRFGDPHGSWAN